MSRGMLVLFLLTMLAGTAVSCTPSPPVARHTVSKYRADASLRREVFAECLNDPGGIGQTPDCVNAREAERLEGRSSLRDQAPVGLDPNGRR